MHTYIHSPRTSSPAPELLALLSSPRAHLLDLSHVDDASGTTLLHEAVRRKDFKVIELAIQGGADVFVRDLKGTSLRDIAADKTRAFLRKCES